MIPEKFSTRNHLRIRAGKEIVGEYTGEDSTDDTSETMGREYVKGIVKKVTVTLPSHRHIAADRDEEGNEYALPDCHPSRAVSDG